ncbi:MAG: putative acetyltransferase [Massilia sp.]|jgi:predicted N-acetyltransferase YhbS
MYSPPSLRIRTEQAGDIAAINAVLRAAFTDHPHSDGSEHLIVKRLRARRKLALSLVALDDDDIVGCLALSPVTIEGVEGGWMGLGPLAVMPARQGRGIGAALVEAGLAALDALGAAGCVVLGEPAYYGRFGFRHEPGLRYLGAPAEYFMARQRDDRAAPAGVVRYDDAFG